MGDAMRECCEQQELIEANGALSPDVIKSGNSELQGIWKIGQSLWKRDFSGVYNNVKAKEWSATTQPLIERLCVILRERMVRLIGQAYSVITIADFIRLLGLDEGEVVDFARNHNWEVDTDNKLVKPKRGEVVTPQESKNAASNPEAFDQLMNSLTDYVTFLEN